MQKLLIVFALLFVGTPAAAEELTRMEKLSLRNAETALNACKTFTSGIVSFDLSIKNCKQFKQRFLAADFADTPFTRASDMIHATAIDAEIAKLYLWRNEPDLAGCQFVKDSMRKFSSFPEVFEDREGLNDLGIDATQRLYRYASKCSDSDLEEILLIVFGELGQEFASIATPCTTNEGDDLAAAQLCDAALKQVLEKFEGSADTLIANDVNTFVVANMSILDGLFRAADRAGAFKEAVCPGVSAAQSISVTSAPPVNGVLVNLRDDYDKSFDAYAARCDAE